MTQDELFVYMIEQNLRFATLDEPGYVLAYIDLEQNRIQCWVTDDTTKEYNHA